LSSYPTDLKRIALYLRKSRADQEAELRGEGETLSKHRRALFEMAKKYRYAIEDVYEEVVSGERIIDRPEMQRLLHAIRDDAYTAVLCMDVDRLGRGNMVDQGLIQDAFKSSKTLIITPRKVYDLQDEMDEEWSEFEAFMARRELKIITRRMQRGRRQSAAEGKSVSKKPPFGYLRDENLKLYPDPVTAPVIKMIFEWMADGMGSRTVANKLQSMGILSPSGNKRWDKSTLSWVIHNPVYIGHITWGRITHQKDSQQGKYIQTRQPEERWIMHENAHEPLIDDHTFAKAQEMAEQNNPRIPAGLPLANSLATLIFCVQCGRSMKHQKRYNARRNGLLCVTGGCDTRGAVFELVEERVIEALREVLTGLDVTPDMVDKKPKSAQKEMNRRSLIALESQREELLKQRNNLHDLLERGVYDIDTFLERNRILSERIDKTDVDLAAAKDEALRHDEQQENTPELHPRIAHVLERYGSVDNAEEKNKLLKSIIERIIYRRQPDWKGTDNFELEITLRF